MFTNIFLKIHKCNADRHSAECECVQMRWEPTSTGTLNKWSSCTYISDQPFNMLRILRNTCQNWGKSPVPPHNCKCSMHGYPAKVFLHKRIIRTMISETLHKNTTTFSHVFSLPNYCISMEVYLFDAWSKWAWLIIIIIITVNVGFFLFFFTKFLYFHGSVHVLMHEVNEPD